ncbi:MULTISPECIES: FAD-binding protein [unclassified Frankia]|uniref:FAD-dependent oxidoreductase n=1 Tax=unclassified Frankia TaxID=2632575 RepID=UPI001EF61562|nr:MULTISPECIES: FAD-binding protein [unclassified Frankia]
MGEVSRRGILIGGTAVAVGAATPAIAAQANTTPADSTAGSGYVVTPAVSVTASDARYPELVRGINQRWVAAPDAVRLVRSTAQVVQAVQEAVDAGKRLSVRSGGHCYADFVSNPDTKILLDLSGMSCVSFDPQRAAFRIEAGAQLGHIYELLYRDWGVTIPGGVCPTVGIGGHASGGGFGLLSRKFGLVADHIDAVEMVVVGSDGKARVVIASRGSADPNNDLWWATTGGGGGNFGVVTRFWFRSASATGTDPGAALPRPPARVLLSSVPVPWSALSQASFTTLVRNFGRWHEQNSAPSSPYTSLAGIMFIRQGPTGGIQLVTQLDGTLSNAGQLLADYRAALLDGSGITVPFPARPVAWLASTRLVGTSNPALLYDPTLRSAVKSAYLRTSFTDDQIAAIYINMTRTDYTNANATLQLSGSGGQINAMAPAATATAHRNAVVYALFENFWISPAEDTIHIAWLRDLYSQTFAATGGYPIPNEQTDGCYINNPDPDIIDPAINTSGVPFSTLYYKDNYTRLRRVKGHWDPTNVFRHSQSIALP